MQEEETFKVPAGILNMFGLVRAKKVKELENKINALEKQLEAVGYAREESEDDELTRDLEREADDTGTWQKAKQQLIELAAKHPTPQTLVQVKQSLDIIRKLEASERNRERYYRGEVLTGRGRGRPTKLEQLLDANPDELAAREDDLHALFLDYYAKVRDKPWFRLIKGRVNDYVRNQLQIENFDLDELQDPGKFDLVMKAVIPRLKQYVNSVAPSSASSAPSSQAQEGGLAVSPTLNPRNPGPLLLQNGVPVGQLQVAGAEEQKQ